ncbi:MAG: peptidase U32 family protein [Rectinemataceae bacterium]
MASDSRAEILRIPELLLPAGSFESALAAIEGGADALYFGFADYSARKQARNLDRLEYRRLLGHARDRGVRLYAALNTVILEKELGDITGLLVFLSRFPPDAIIVQDWGLARLVRERFPALSLHASTQMAIQTPQAAHLAARLGIDRIVLPRESSLADLRRFAAEAPELEFEVFVHGALCYSFSGLCLASGLLVGRSGNRGECAQVCRSYYSREDPAGRGGSSYLFSCRDLRLTKRIAALAQAGASSLKVEGRMKGPEYGFAVARLYRGILDRLAGRDVADEDLAASSEAADLAFSREPTEAWFASRGGDRLIDPAFPGHRGVHAGRIIARRGERIVVDLATRLGLRDGVLLFEDGDPSRPLAFSATGLRDERTGRELGIARPGGRVEIDCPGSAQVGSELRRISARELDRRQPSPEEYPPRRQDIPATLFFTQGGLGLRLQSPPVGGDEAGGVEIGRGEILALQKARRPGGFIEALNIFEESGDADFRLVPGFEPGESVDLDSGEERLRLSPGDLFLPPSVLKREKNRLYAEARRLVAIRYEELAAAAARWNPDAPAASVEESIAPPPRSELVFAVEEPASGMPFATPRLLRERAPLPRIEGRYYLPLAALVADIGEYEKLVRLRIEGILDEGNSVVVGLDALHHIAFAQSLIEEFSARDPEARGLRFFLDIHLYVANRLTLASFAFLPWLSERLAFAYFYLEAEESDLRELRKALGGHGPSLAAVDPRFEPPLFLSSGCLRKHHAEGGVCPADCDRHWISRLRDRKRRYVAITDDCVSMLFRL